MRHVLGPLLFPGWSFCNSLTKFLPIFWVNLPQPLSLRNEPDAPRSTFPEVNGVNGIVWLKTAIRNEDLPVTLTLEMSTNVHVRDVFYTPTTQILKNVNLREFTNSATCWYLGTPSGMYLVFTNTRCKNMEIWTT